jgi:hypothetical protein
MSFREKSAWVTLTAILLVFLLYVLHAPHLTDPGLWEVHILLACIVAFVVIELVAYIVLRLRYSEDARTPKDERERLIDLKAIRLAARVYVIGSFLAVLFGLHLAHDGRAVGSLILVAFVIAEIVNYGARIYYYRSGA